jgi:TolB-like protein/Tfp pilus assembly protein PilF
LNTFPKNRLAVLPFDNYSPNSTDEYISYGFTEEIISVLSNIKDMQVIARTSVMKYKNIVTDINEVAQDLNVGLVLEGSVRKDQDRIRLTVQLIDSKSQNHLWYETYDEKYEQIFDLQNDIAFRVAESLEIKLKEMEIIGIKKKATKNIEAYNLYLRGRYYWNTRLPANLMAGMEYYHKAIGIDPNYALAYTGLADTYHLLASYGLRPPATSFERAKEAATHALKLDDKLAEAYNSLAAINLLYDWDWKAAEEGFVEALKLKPHYVQSYLWYALYLSVIKEFEKAKSQIYSALEIDPLSAIARTDLAQVYYHQGNYAQAITEYQKSIELDSTYVYTYAYLGQVYAVQGLLNEAEKAFSYAAQLTDHKDPATLAGLAYVYALQKKTNQSIAILSQLQTHQEDFYVHPMYIAIVYVAMEDFDEAMHWLEKGYDDRSEWMIFLQVEHMLDPLRGDERFIELVKKMDFN